MTSSLFVSTSIASVLLCALPVVAAAQDPTSQPPASPSLGKNGAPAAAGAPIERLAAWPKPANKDELLLDIERLIKVRTPEMGVQAREALVAAGASAVPFVLERYGKEKDEDVARRLREVLTETTGPEHTRLLAKEFESKHAPARSFALWRAAAFPDPEIRPAAEAAWARIAKLGEKAAPDERYAAALACAASGSVLGLDALFEAAQKSWDKRGTEIRVALEGCRGAEATKIALEKLKQPDADRKQKVAALRLLAGCGDKSAAGPARFLLDDDDNSVRIAAINALRGIVDGEPPLEQLPVFEAIETAKKWKSRAL